MFHIVQAMNSNLNKSAVDVNNNTAVLDTTIVLDAAIVI